MANSKLASEFSVRWAELKFPPINLWVMASLSYDDAPAQKASAYIHRRKGLKSQPNALHKLHRRFESLLAVRGGKL